MSDMHIEGVLTLKIVEEKNVTRAALTRAVLSIVLANANPSISRPGVSSLKTRGVTEISLSCLNSELLLSHSKGALLF